MRNEVYDEEQPENLYYFCQCLGHPGLRVIPGDPNTPTSDPFHCDPATDSSPGNTLPDTDFK